jgi:hypothetical protein
MSAGSVKVRARLEATPSQPLVSRTTALKVVVPRRVRDPSSVERGGDRSAPPVKARPSILWPQRALHVSSPNDPAEREAEATARTVMGTSAARVWSPGGVGRAAPRRMVLPNAIGAVRARARPNASSLLRASQAAEPEVSEALSQEIEGSLATGTPLPPDVRGFMEPRLRADFSAVRIHTDEQAARLSARLSARAFAYGRDIFFGRGEYRPNEPEGAELLVHELTHTIQQQAVVQRSEEPTVTDRPPAQIQRLGLSDILDGLAELAANVPGYTLLTLIIGRNPINMRVVERNAVNLLRAFMGLIPGGEILFQVLDRYGIMQRLGDWVTQQTAALGLSFQSIREAFSRFIDSLGWRDIFSPGDVWRRAREIFTPTITRIRNFISGLVSQAITWLKETFLQPLSAFCREIPGYGLVTVLLGRDPFTNVAVPRTALNVVRAFAEFIPGGTEKVNQLVQSRALERAYQWFIAETRARNLTWERVTGTFARAWSSLRLEDVLHPIDTLQRMVGFFRPLLADLVGFAGAALMKLAELIFEAAMGAGGARIVAIFRRARDTFNTIIRDPVGFLRNLLASVGQGVRQFMNNILRHLREGVIAWLTGPVARAGIQMPEQWDLRGIIWFVLQILGLTWPNIRQKLVRLMGERPVAMLEAGFQLLMEIREKGLVQALRDRVTEFFGQLREAALGAIRSFIQQRLVMAGIQQLLSLLNPVTAIIQAIIKIYNTIKFFIDKINEILDLVESIVNSIAEIAAGRIGQAANFVERTMARTIPVILDFLARFIGLGDVGAQVQATIRGLQARVDQMLDRAVDWIRRQAASLASRALGGDPNAPPQQRLGNGLREGAQAVNRLSGTRIGLALINPVLAAVKLRNNMRTLEAQPRGTRWAVVGEVNPRGEQLTEKLVETGAAVGNFRATITYHAVNDLGFGTHMVADPVGPGHPAGSTVSQTLRLELREDRGSRTGLGSIAARQGRYRLGHLLNHHIGGPGNDWRNLTPITPSANTAHLNAVERNVKTLVLTHNRWVRYEVTADYSGSTPPVTGNVNVLESRFARLLRWSYQLKKPSDSNPNQLVDDPQSVAAIPASGSNFVPSISSSYAP